MVNRILRDDPSKGGMDNRQALSLQMLWQCLTDYHMWPIYLIGLSWEIPKVPISQYITLNLRAAGFDTFQVNLLTIPAYVLWIIGLIFWTRLSERLNERFLLSTVSQIWMLPILIALEALPPHRNHWVTWILTVLLFAQPYVHAILVGLGSRNAGSVRTRTVSAALYNMSIQLGGIIGSNVSLLCRVKRRECGQLIIRRSTAPPTPPTTTAAIRFSSASHSTIWCCLWGRNGFMCLGTGTTNWLADIIDVTDTAQESERPMGQHV